jgi:hypothetical protein
MLLHLRQVNGKDTKLGDEPSAREPALPEEKRVVWQSAKPF